MVAVLEMTNPGAEEESSRGGIIRKRFLSDRPAVAGVLIALFLFLCAVYAPLIANRAPLLVLGNGGLSFPAFRSLFAPESPEILVERLFNSLIFILPGISLIVWRIKKKKLKIIACLLFSVLVPTCFFTIRTAPDRTDWNKVDAFKIYAPVRYGPFETAGIPYGKPDAAHPFGTDHAGRDVLARMVSGARVSTAVGFLATAISMLIGTALGILSGYRGGKLDLFIMRVVEIVTCFPMFLLLLILMSIMLDYGSRQSILLVIAVIGISGWTGLCTLVRGETLKQRSLPYVAAAESMGVPLPRLLLRHILPNVSGPIFVSFTFCIAGAILAESSLSFLGFGVQDPAASWGELMRQAFPDPVTYWNLTLWPGLAIFLAVCAFNFIGEGLRKALRP